MERVSSRVSDRKIRQTEGSVDQWSGMGVTHLPLIWFGFNYSLDNPGAPYTNMAMMLVVCVVMGILFPISQYGRETVCMRRSCMEL